MVYDQGVDLQSINGPVKAEIVIRSQQASKRSSRNNSRVNVQEDAPVEFLVRTTVSVLISINLRKSFVV